MEDGQGKVITEDGVEAMDYITDDGDEFMLKNLTTLSEYIKYNMFQLHLILKMKN